MIDVGAVHRGKILIVDDQEVNVLLLGQMLRQDGYESVASTTDPTEVCALHLEHHYDLILLDLQMPRMDGFQVMENLKEIEVGSYLPVLVVTAQPDHRVRALRAGAKDFVSKPFDHSEVLIRVYNMLEVRLLNTEAKRLYERVVAEQEASVRLLVDGLPPDLAARLTRPRTTAPAGDLVGESYAEVTVLFSDIVAFTRFAEGADAEVVLGVLGQLSDRFDLEQDGKLDVSGFLGHAYLSVLGMPEPLADRTIHASRKAIEFVSAMDRFNARSRYKLRVSIAIETGAFEASRVVL